MGTILSFGLARIEPTLEPGEALAWRRGEDSPPFRFQIASPRGDRRRHQRKYAEGEIPEYHSFYFRGPEDKLNLRAQNLNLFLQLGDGVDDATWLHHLRRGDYSRWFRDVIRDEELAAEASRVERDTHLDMRKRRAPRFMRPWSNGTPTRPDALTSSFRLNLGVCPPMKLRHAELGY